MTQEKLIREIKQLPPEDERALLDVMLEIVRDEMRAPVTGTASVEELSETAKSERLNA